MGFPVLTVTETPTSPKPVVQKATDGYSLLSRTVPAPQTNLLTCLLYTSSAILSILCLLYVSRQERTPGIKVRQDRFLKGGPAKPEDNETIW